MLHFSFHGHSPAGNKILNPLLLFYLVYYLFYLVLDLYILLNINLLQNLKRHFELVKRHFELVKRHFELVKRHFELVLSVILFLKNKKLIIKDLYLKTLNTD